MPSQQQQHQQHQQHQQQPAYAAIIGLDLGKFKSVACAMDVATRTHAFTTLVTSPKELHDFLAARLGGDGRPEPSRVLLVLETCDAAGWVHDLAEALGLAVAVANPSGEAWKWRRLKRKTDRDDALKLATLALLGQLPAVHVPPPEQRQRRQLVQYRRTLVARRTRVKNQVRSVFSQQGLPLPRGKQAWTAAGVEEIRGQAKELESCDVGELWRGRLHVELAQLESVDEQLAAVEAKLDALASSDGKVKLLTGVKGVGPRLAEAVVCCLDDPHRFKTAGQVGSYAGLVPKQIESGQMRRVGRITRRGSSLLRGLLVEVAWAVWRHNDWAKAFVERVGRGMKNRRRVAIVALARKLLVMLWAMLRDNEPWREPGAVARAGQKVARCAAGV
jgi:transposase